MYDNSLNACYQSNKCFKCLTFLLPPPQIAHFHRIEEYIRLEGISGDCLVQSPPFRDRSTTVGF